MALAAGSRCLVLVGQAASLQTQAITLESGDVIGKVVLTV